MTSIGDNVLIHFEDQPAAFARVEDISPDVKRGWFHVKLLLLQLPLPLQTVTWILRDVYIDGTEFTMNGNRMRIEKVTAPVDPEEVTDEKKETAPAVVESLPEPQKETEESAKPEKDATVISFSDLKKR